jgi:hypothetical protein
MCSSGTPSTDAPSPCTRGGRAGAATQHNKTGCATLPHRWVVACREGWQGTHSAEAARTQTSSSPPTSRSVANPEGGGAHLGAAASPLRTRLLGFSSSPAPALLRACGGGGGGDSCQPPMVDSLTGDSAAGEPPPPPPPVERALSLSLLLPLSLSLLLPLSLSRRRGGLTLGLACRWRPLTSEAAERGNIRPATPSSEERCVWAGGRVHSAQLGTPPHPTDGAPG